MRVPLPVVRHNSLWLFLFVVGLWCFISNPPAIAASPVMSLSLNEGAGPTFVDSSGFGNQGGCSGGTCPVGTSGEVNSASLFNGASTYINVFGASSLKPASTVAVAAWIRASSAPTDGGEIISMGDSYSMRALVDGNVRFFFYVGNNVWTNVDTTGLNVLDNTFHHLLGQKTATDLEIYIDGIKQATKPATGTISYTLGPSLNVGRHANGFATRYFNGTIDEVKVYTQPLTLPEVATLANAAPSTYAALTTRSDPNAFTIPIPPPALGTANTVINDPKFGSRILRVTDGNTLGGASLVPEDSGTHRGWNANASALKLKRGNGCSFWLEFNPLTFRVGNGSSTPTLHAMPCGSPNYASYWEWSAVDPDILYAFHVPTGTQMVRYNIRTGASVNLAGPSNGHTLGLHVSVAGADNWVCSTAGPGSQNSYKELFCVNPSTLATKLIDIQNKTINGVPQSDPNWPTAKPGETLGIHSTFGSSGGQYLGVVFHECDSSGNCNNYPAVVPPWDKNGVAVFDLVAHTWQKLTNADIPTTANGHVALGNFRFTNGAGSQNGMDSRGAIIRNPSGLMSTGDYQWIMTPPSTQCWCDGEHSSWFNSAVNGNAPILYSRYNITSQPSPLTWYGEIIAAATDGSGTVWRFAHNHNRQNIKGYYASAFAQISNNGRWAVFSSDWEGTLGASSNDFNINTRLDTFIVELK